MDSDVRVVLHPTAFQDENSLASRGGITAGAGVKAAGGGQGGLPFPSSSKAAQQPFSARKAFGNVTNVSCGGNSVVDGAIQKPQSTTKKGSSSRVAFGDLTNSSQKTQAGPSAAGMAMGGNPAATPSAFKVQPPPLTSSEPHPKADHPTGPGIAAQHSSSLQLPGVPSMEDEGVERWAGKTWQQQEAELERQQELEQEERVQSMVQCLLLTARQVGTILYSFL
jgi:hypothetical protein